MAAKNEKEPQPQPEKPATMPAPEKVPAEAAASKSSPRVDDLPEKPSPAPIPTRGTRLVDIEPQEPPGAVKRSFRVWTHGTLQRNGKIYEPGAVLSLTLDEAAKIPCLEPLP